MKRTAIISVLALALAWLGTASLLANVTVTTATGGPNLSADNAQNGAAPAFTTLGNVEIQENDPADFASGTDVTLILTAPSDQTAGVSFDLTQLVAADRQFNIAGAYSGTETISYSGPGSTPSYTTNVSFSSGQSTTTLATTLMKAETTTLTATDGIVPGV